MGREHSYYFREVGVTDWTFQAVTFGPDLVADIAVYAVAVHDGASFECAADVVQGEC